jgi:hypothetical protein
MRAVVGRRAPDRIRRQRRGHQGGTGVHARRAVATLARLDASALSAGTAARVEAAFLAAAARAAPALTSGARKAGAARAADAAAAICAALFSRARGQAGAAAADAGIRAGARPAGPATAVGTALFARTRRDAAARRIECAHRGARQGALRTTDEHARARLPCEVGSVACLRSVGDAIAARRGTAAARRSARAGRAARARGRRPSARADRPGAARTGRPSAARARAAGRSTRGGVPRAARARAAVVRPARCGLVARRRRRAAITAASRLPRTVLGGATAQGRQESEGQRDAGPPHSRRTMAARAAKQPTEPDSCRSGRPQWELRLLDRGSQAFPRSRGSGLCMDAQLRAVGSWKVVSSTAYSTARDPRLGDRRRRSPGPAPCCRAAPPTDRARRPVAGGRRPRRAAPRDTPFRRGRSDRAARSGAMKAAGPIVADPLFSPA